MRRAVAVAVVVLGCGRLRVDPEQDATVAPPGTPPVPAVICKVTRMLIDTVPAIADLAIAPTAEGFTAIWVDTAGVLPAHGVRLGVDLEVLAARDMPDVTDRALGGLADAGQKLVLAGATGTTETHRVVSRDLASAVAQSMSINHVMGHEPYPSDARLSKRVFLTAVANQLVGAYVAGDGLVNPQTSVFSVPGTVTDLACTEGPDHSHCAWAEDLPTGGSRCTIADVGFDATPEVSSTIVWNERCRDLRNASGPSPADGMIVVWTTPAGAVQARYAVSTGDVIATIAPAGSAPRVRFDGMRFWVAWLDPAGEPRLAALELDGAIVEYALTGWAPRGPEAFELVSRDTTVALAVLRAGELDVLTLCP